MKMTKKNKISVEVPSVEKKIVSPAQASAWLEENKFNNRRLDDRNVDKIARDIKNDKWVFDGSPIRFDKSSNIIDGQHRLWGIVMAGKPVECLIIRGLEECTKFTIDSGKARSNSDMFHFAGYVNNAMLASVCRLSLGHKENKGDLWKWAKDNSHKRLTAQELLNEAQNNKNAEKSVSAILPKKMIRKMLGGSLAAFCYYLLAKSCKELYLVDNFFNSLETGTNLEAESPILVLRNTFTIRERNFHEGRGGNKTMAYRVAIFIKAWNAWRENRVIKILRFDPDVEAYPVPK